MLGGSADRLCTPSTSSGPFRLFAIPGFQNRTNDVVYCPPLIRQPNQNVEDSTAIVYFGGDVQDFPESMETNRDSRSYMKYNLENSAILLREAFPLCHVLVIRPVRMEFKTFSCFDNFVRGNNAGVPDHTPMNHALHHLEKLLQNVTHRLLSIPENEIVDQAEQAAAATAAVAAAAAATTHASENNQEMDIDILQVQDTNVTGDNDGAVLIPNSDNSDKAVANHVAVGTAGSVSATKHSLNNAQHFNNVNNGSNSSSSCSKSNNANDDASPVHPTSTSTQKQRNTLLLQQQQQHHQQQQQNNQNSSLWWRENLNLDKAKLILIGFSKGCVVLNQFIYEFHYLKTLTPDDSSMIRLLSRFKEMYWLDGGHGGQKNTWITARSLLETLTRMGLNIHVHLTPYQVQDDRRPWIRKEEKIFTDMLRRLGAHLSRHLHFEAQPSNLMTHFEVLQAFCLHVHAVNQQLRQQNQMPVNALNVEQMSEQLPQQQQQQQQIQQEATAAEQLASNNSIDGSSSSNNITNLSRTDIETNNKHEK